MKRQKTCPNCKQEAEYSTLSHRECDSCIAGTNQFCGKCNTVKHKKDFSPWKATASKRHPYCRACLAKAKRIEYAELRKFRQIVLDQRTAVTPCDIQES